MIGPQPTNRLPQRLRNFLPYAGAGLFLLASVFMMKAFWKWAGAEIRSGTYPPITITVSDVGDCTAGRPDQAFDNQPSRVTCQIKAGGKTYTVNDLSHAGGCAWFGGGRSGPRVKRCANPWKDPTITAILQSHDQGKPMSCTNNKAIELLEGCRLGLRRAHLYDYGYDSGRIVKRGPLNGLL